MTDQEKEHVRAILLGNAQAFQDQPDRMRQMTFLVRELNYLAALITADLKQPPDRAQHMATDPTKPIERTL